MRARERKGAAKEREEEGETKNEIDNGYCAPSLARSLDALRLFHDVCSERTGR